MNPTQSMSDLLALVLDAVDKVNDRIARFERDPYDCGPSAADDAVQRARDQCGLAWMVPGALAVLIGPENSGTRRVFRLASRPYTCKNDTKVWVEEVAFSVLVWGLEPLPGAESAS